MLVFAVFHIYLTIFTGEAFLCHSRPFRLRFFFTIQSLCTITGGLLQSPTYENMKYLWYEINLALSINHYLYSYHYIYIIIPPAQRSCWGGILVSLRPSVRLSVCPSVRPSVPHAVSALYHLQLWMDSFHIRHKWSLPWEGVSRTMTFDLDLYLQGHLALT